MKNYKKSNNFLTLIYLGLSIFALESLVYFSKLILTPPVSFAQSDVEATRSAITPPVDISYKLPILIYHYVEYVTDERDTIRKSLNIEPHIFRAQIKTLKDAGYTFITPSNIPSVQNGSITKSVILSFDDGYKDFYSDVYPILKEENTKAVAYIVPGFVGKLNYMTWDDVKGISQSGLVEIGAHTMNHRSLGNLPDTFALQQMSDSKLVLDLSLGSKITTFAYPYGHFNERTPNLAQKAGFTSAVTTLEGRNDQNSDTFILKRIHPGTSIGESLLSKL